MSGRFRFIKSATQLQECPSDPMPEIAVLGRSNAGKSSLVNAWTGSALAKISAKPGKTRLINFFESKAYRLVDFPGYGYSARSGDEQASWAGMIEPVLGARENFRAALILVDCRREVADEERLLLNFLKHRGLPVAIVLTKVDKLNRSEADKVKRASASITGVDHVALVSSLKKTGLVELEEFVFQSWIQTSGSTR